MVIKISIRKIISVLLAAVILLAVTLTARAVNSAVSDANDRMEPTVIIDAGHGGFDGGAVAIDGTLEKDLNLQIANKLKQHFVAAGFRTVTVRETDTAYDPDGRGEVSKTVDMSGRLQLLNKYKNSVFISIHMNKFTSAQPHGAQVFYAPSVSESQSLAEEIQLAITSMVDYDNTRKIKAGSKDTYLLYNAENPAVIVECGFLSNTNELKNLKDDNYQNKIAFAIFCGFMNFYTNPVSM